ncbi:MAG: hypothetical protein NTV43_10600 [Methylococcales bacterium]|nr:hypothetical protein [Methylococcales bacterium]
MKLFAKIIPYFLLLLMSVGYCRASSEHEQSVGAQKEQFCSTKAVAVVGKFLGIDTFKLPPNGEYPNPDAIIAAAACKLNPANKKTTIAAMAYDAKKADAKALVIALLDEAQGKVIASYKSEIGEDAAMRVESGSLWIDTAAYNLQEGVRAFSVDITSGYIPHCGDGGFGAIRALYVQEKEAIRPILEGLTLSYWMFIQQGQSRCTGPDAPEQTIIENLDFSINVEKTKANGFNDLSITAVSSRDDGVKTKRKPFRFKLSYDGKKYPIDAMDKAFWQWRS